MRPNTTLFLGLLLLSCWFLRPAPAQDLMDDEQPDDIEALDELTDTGWWRPEWACRRRVKVEGPGLLLQRGHTVFFPQPDPLLLYNTGRCQKGAVDLRIVTLAGEQVPAGVLNFGRDDGTSLVWCRPGAALKGTELELMLYYGNPKAKPSDAKLALGEEPPEKLAIRVQVGDEEVRQDLTPPPAPVAGSFFRRLVAVEAEKAVDAEGNPVIQRGRWTPDSMFQLRKRDDASAASHMTCPPRVHWNQTEPFEKPLEAWLPTRIPEAGVWRMHVRYKTSLHTPRQPGRPVRITTKYMPFTVFIGEKEFRCGTRHPYGAEFLWDSFTTELPAGDIKLGLRFTGPSPAGPDCIILTKDLDYLPDYRDVTGPVWMRFQVSDGAPEPFSLELFCYIQPWSSHGPQGRPAGYMFRDRVLPLMEEAQPLARNPKYLLRQGEWSPWVQALHSRGILWWSHLRAHAGKRGILRTGLTDLEIAFELASRPDQARVFRNGVNAASPSPGLNILMPSALDMATMRRDTLSFVQWAHRRFEVVRELGLKPGQRPQEIVVTTMATSKSAEEAEYIMKTCGLLGFNGLRIRAPMEPLEIRKLAASYGLRTTSQHHWYPKDPYTVYSRFLKMPPKGETCERAVLRILAELSRNCYSPQGKRWTPESPYVEMLIMGDEIGPMISPLMMKVLPMIRGYFIEYLEQQGLKPEFFGKKKWAEVEPAGAEFPEMGSKTYTLLTTLDPSLAKAPETPELPDNVTLQPEEDGEFDLARDMQEEEERQAAAMAANTPEPGASPHEKRLHYWTTRFRSYYTARFYRTMTKEINALVEAGHFRRRPKASPNFQASPVQRSSMWGGALNLFEWGRMGATDYMMVEDWNWDAYRISFGAELLRAAARKRGQEIGALIVGGSIRQRFLADLGNGARGIMSYLYGPQRVIGPPWAEHQDSVQQWADMLSWVAKCEKDLLAAKNRPSEVGVLVANTSETNSVFINASFHRYPMAHRADMYAGLKDSYIPVEVVGEEEVIEDGILAQYKALYVGDSHVDERAQKKIKEWVAAGGVLWAPYHGLARQEYDEPSRLFDEVFGLAHRPPLAPAPLDRPPAMTPRIAVPESPFLAAVSFPSVGLKPDYKLSTGVALAQFEDGKPALIHNRYGKGQAFLFAAPSFICTSGHHQRIDEPPDAAKMRRVLAIAARAAGVRPHVRLSHPRVLSYVHDGPQQTILILASCFEGVLDNVQVELSLPRPALSAYSGRTDDFKFTQDGGTARFTVDLGTGGGEIIVFRLPDAGK